MKAATNKFVSRVNIVQGKATDFRLENVLFPPCRTFINADFNVHSKISRSRTSLDGSLLSNVSTGIISSLLPTD